MTDTPRNPGNGAVVLAFPKAPASASPHAFADLGPSALARQLGAPTRQGTGHWCSHCRGIWFGYPLEVTCPNCGSRHG